jgi:hypothetical protein
MFADAYGQLRVADERERLKAPLNYRRTNNPQQTQA